MKVLFISVFPPNPAPEANHALHICEHLANLGVTVHVLCQKGSIAATHKNIFMHSVVDDWSWSDLPRVKKCVKECCPDVVFLLYLPWIYNHKPMPAFLPTICKKVLNGVPCVTQFDGPPSRPFAGRTMRNAMALLLGRWDIDPFFGTLHRDSDRIIVLSSPHRDYLSYFNSEVYGKTVIIPPPPLIRHSQDDPADTRKRVRHAIGATDSDFVFMFWGYIYPGKGVETLLHAFGTVWGELSNVRLVLVGGSLDIPNFQSRDYYHRVRALPDKLGIGERITWTGHFNWDSDAGSTYLHAGDACILPIDYGVTLNNSSLAAASTHGLPIIGTTLPKGADEDLEHGRHIYLCRPKNPQELAGAMKLLIQNADFRESLRQGSRELAQKWHCWESTTRRLVDVLENEISGKGNSSNPYTQSSPFISGSRAQILNDSFSPRIPAQRPESPREMNGGLPQSNTVGGPVRVPDESNPPLVSVVVAAYNVSKFLSQCFDSLVHQTLKPIEIIVVNDASTDRSPEIINEYQTQYGHIRVINCEKNLGLASARNLGMRAAKGAYVGFVDGDDWADPYKYELMYHRAKRDAAEVVFAGIKPFVDDSKFFMAANDQHLWNTLSPDLNQGAFCPREEPCVFKMEPAVWAKLYKRSFLLDHGLTFEDGMNSVEDVIFHFEVLWKAKRISLLDKSLSFYRLNRPGQITGRTDRRLFETFDVFGKCTEKLKAWDAPKEIWGALLSTELRFYDWMLKDRVPDHLKSEFLSACSRELREIPKEGFLHYGAQINPDRLPKIYCMRRNWLRAYENVSRRRWPLFPMLYVALNLRRLGFVKEAYSRWMGKLTWYLTMPLRPFLKKLYYLAGMEGPLELINRRLEDLTTSVKTFTAQGQNPLVEVFHVDGQPLLFSNKTGFGKGSISRVLNDYYLLQTAVFRQGDIVVDVGAHVGYISIYLAKKYPFIKVYALEPDPTNYECLVRNIELNKVTNIHAINRALSGDGKKRMLYVSPWDYESATINTKVASTWNKVLRVEEVNTVTLEQLFQEHRIVHCRLLKVSALGAVGESLKAFTKRGCVDFLCGEAFLEEFCRTELEVASWSIARQHFWRTYEYHPGGSISSWIYQAPTAVEGCSRTSSITVTPSPDLSLSKS